MRYRRKFWLGLAAGAMCSIALADDFQGAAHLMPFDEDTIRYSKSVATGEVARLQARIDAGGWAPEFSQSGGYLEDLLAALEISPASQVLVASKTSLQRDRISPATPRAIYFNDDVYVGYIPGAPLIEVSMADPKLGGVFYTLKQQAAERPQFVRTDQCLECHASSKSMGVPGHLLRSFDTDESGNIDLISGSSLLTHRSPFEERWGGWYVTGELGGQAHRGNLFGAKRYSAERPEGRLFDESRYLSGESDVVALLVLQHQVHMHNFITRLRYAGTLAEAQYGHINYLNNVIEAFLKYLLFVEEAPLAERIRGGAEYAGWFEGQGPFDSQGRSLRQFDLESRLFKYPCSYLIYSEAFEHLPASVKDCVYKRLYEILTSQDLTGGYGTMARKTKRALFEILRDTKPDLREFWDENCAEAAGTASGGN